MFQSPRDDEGGVLWPDQLLSSFKKLSTYAAQSALYNACDAMKVFLVMELLAAFTSECAAETVCSHHALD